MTSAVVLHGHYTVMVGPAIRIAGERNVVLQSVPGSPSVEGSAVFVRVRPILQITDDQLYALCRLNRELRIERTAQGGLSITART